MKVMIIGCSSAGKTNLKELILSQNNQDTMVLTSTTENNDTISPTTIDSTSEFVSFAIYSYHNLFEESAELLKKLKDFESINKNPFIPKKIECKSVSINNNLIHTIRNKLPIKHRQMDFKAV